jgi:hypothetical protein
MVFWVLEFVGFVRVLMVVKVTGVEERESGLGSSRERVMTYEAWKRQKLPIPRTDTGNGYET